MALFTKSFGGGELLIAGADCPQRVRQRADYKLDGDASDVTKINAAIAEAHYVSLTNNYITPHIVGSALIYTPINMTYGPGQPLYRLDLTGATLMGLTNGLPVFDMTGANQVIVRGGMVYGGGSNGFTGVPARKPNVGVLMARRNTGESAGHIIFEGTSFQGYFTVSAIYNYGSEEDVWRDCYITNWEPNCHCMAFTSSNVAALASSFVTIAAGYQSTTANNLIGTQCQNYAVGGSGTAIYILPTNDSNSYNFHMWGGQLFSAGQAGIQIDLSNAPAAGAFGFLLDGVQMTDLVPAFNVLVSNSSGLARRLERMHITRCIGQASTLNIYTGNDITPNRWIVDRTNTWVGPGYVFTIGATNSDIYGP